MIDTGNPARECEYWKWSATGCSTWRSAQVRWCRRPDYSRKVVQ